MEGLIFKDLMNLVDKIFFFIKLFPVEFIKLPLLEFIKLLIFKNW